MNLVLLSGGSGQRLWPLSNDIRSKQFIKFFHREDGELESMVQRVYRQIKAAIRMQRSPLPPPSLRSRPSTISWVRKLASAWNLAAVIPSPPSHWQRLT